MKALINILLVNILFSAACLAQLKRQVVLSLSSENDKINLAKSSISIPDWHQESFWSLYERYAKKIRQPAGVFYLSLDSLLNENGHDVPEFDKARMLISSGNDALTVTQEYFGEICTNFNGTIALDFLQTELLFDIIENLNMFERHPERHFSFYPWSTASGQNKLSKHDAIVAAVGLSPLEEENFFSVYCQYEQECNDLLGEDYNLFALFNEDPSDYTPAIAKGLARNLLLLWQRERALKEKYFMRLDHDHGPSLAARFIVWENYYSAISKMYAWANQSSNDQVEYWTSQK